MRTVLLAAMVLPYAALAPEDAGPHHPGVVPQLVPGSSYWYDLFGYDTLEHEGFLAPVPKDVKQTIDSLVKLRFLELQDEYLEGALYGDYVQEIEALRTQLGELRAFVKKRMDLDLRRNLMNLFLCFVLTVGFGWSLMAWKRRRAKTVQTVLVAEPVSKEDAAVVAV